MFRIAFIIFFRKSFWTDDAIERTGCPKRLVMIKFDDINILFAPLFEYDTIFFLNFQQNVDDIKSLNMNILRIE